MSTTTQHKLKWSAMGGAQKVAIDGGHTYRVVYGGQRAGKQLAYEASVALSRSTRVLASQWFATSAQAIAWCEAQRAQAVTP